MYPNFVPRMAPLLLDNGNEGESIPTTDGSRQMPQFQREDAQETKSVSHSFSDSSKSMLFHKLRYAKILPIYYIKHEILHLR